MWRNQSEAGLEPARNLMVACVCRTGRRWPSALGRIAGWDVGVESSRSQGLTGMAVFAGLEVSCRPWQCGAGWV